MSLNNPTNGAIYMGEGELNYVSRGFGDLEMISASSTNPVV